MAAPGGRQSGSRRSLETWKLPGGCKYQARCSLHLYGLQGTARSAWRQSRWVSRVSKYAHVSATSVTDVRSDEKSSLGESAGALRKHAIDRGRGRHRLCDGDSRYTHPGFVCPYASAL